MKKRTYFTIYIVFALLLLGSCKTLNTRLSIPEREMPSSYDTSTDTVTIADISWKQYFADTLLLQLIDSALAGNPDLQVALQRIEVARAGKKSALGALLPQVGLNVGGAVRKFGLYTMDGAGNIATEMTPGEIVPIHLPDMYIGLQATWEIDIWGKLRNQRKAAVADYLATIEGTHFVLSSLVADVAIAYYSLVALDNELDIIRQFIQTQQEALGVIQMQKESGRANELAVQQFQAQLLNSQAMEFEILQKIAEAENLVNFLLGRYPQPVQRDKTVLFRDIPSQIAAGVPSQLLSHRPDIRSAEFQVRAARFDLKSAKAAFFPNLQINAGFGFQAFNPEFLFLTPASIAYSVVGGLVAPLINMSALKARFNTAKAHQLAAMYNYQKAILNGYTEVANELSRIRNLEQVYGLKKQQTEVLTLSVATATELYGTAKAGYLEVLLTQQSALQARLELVDVSKRRQMATVNIYKALGGGWK